MITFINGVRHELPLGRADSTLLQYLRENGLTGAKLGCGEGGCGACTVMVSSLEPDGSLLHRSINACLCPLYSIEGMHVITTEGIGNVRDGLHPVQERLAKAHGSQCGFCTPGFVMSMYSLLRSKNGDPVTEEEIEENLAGNLCRCTGYRPILDAFKPFSKADTSVYTDEAIAAATANPHGKSTTSNSDISRTICPSTGQPCDCVIKSADNVIVSTSKEKENGVVGPLHPISKTIEPIFPPELRRRSPQELNIPGPVASWHRPLTLDRLLQLKNQYNDAKLVIGNTEVGIEMKFKHANYPVLLAATHVPELNAITISDQGVTFGASITLTKLLNTCKELVHTLPAHQSSPFAAIAEQIKWFAGPPIRNAASLGGNVCTASPISDLNPLWMACNAMFHVARMKQNEIPSDGSGDTCSIQERNIPAKSFFLGYRTVDLAPGEVLLDVFVPFTRPYEYVKEFKQAHRRDDDIAIVNAGMRFALTENENATWVIEDVSIAFGGVAAATLFATETCDALKGCSLDHIAVALRDPSSESGPLHALRKDVSIPENAPGGMVEYRRILATSFLYKGILHAAIKLEADVSNDSSKAFTAPFDGSCRSAVEQFNRPASHGIQYYSATANERDIVGKPHRHRAADIQVTGEACYVDDMPLPPGCLHAAVIMSTRPHARLHSMDVGKAMEIPGVAGIFTAKDIPAKNDIGAVIHDEELFATNTVTCVGQPIGVVVADTEAAARRAARAVEICYEDLPAVLDIDDAIREGSFLDGWGHDIACGDVDGLLGSTASCLEGRRPGNVDLGSKFTGGVNDIVMNDEENTVFVKGELSMGGQEHFYLEPNAHLVVPGENDEIVSYSSTQCPDKHQRYIGHVLGIAQHKVVVKTKRLGGGFGGKETRAAYLNAIAAVPAYILQRPVRLTLDRDEDMAMTGQRHPYKATYRAVASSEGKLLAIDLQFYANAGNSLDLSHSIMDRSLISCDSCYKIPNLRAKGELCFTNLPTNTAFRGFGGPQGMLAMEHIIEKVACAISKLPEEVRAMNLYKEGDSTPYGMKLEGCRAKACWDGAIASAGGLEARRGAIREFNSQHRYRKRGLAAVPTKFGISFTTKFLNQAGALVHIYQQDGSILITHGGVEMGQGLHTKVCQVVAQALNVPLSSVHVAETATDKVPNSSPTAASASSDMYGAAAFDACTQLNARLAPYREKTPNATFKEIVQAAYYDRVDLSAHGFYTTPDITGFGGTRPFNYLTYGAAVAEVELDTLTGEWHALRCDIVMDVGKSLNPGIDIGQVEGGFVQGMGWSCIEELVWGDKEHPWVRPGTLFTRGPGTYKIPTANDIPIDFRVTLLHDAPCERTPMVYSSKAVGEPPFYLGTSVFWALKDAVYAARKDAGYDGWFQLDSPCTPEKLRMACVDEFIEFDGTGELQGGEGWRPLMSC